MLALVGMAFGATKKDVPTRIEVQEVQKGTHKTTTKRAALPKLVLPNITALVKREWKVDRETLSSQQRKSAGVLAFFEGKGKWLRATRHEKCWQVPWQRSCTVARATYRLHTALGRVATRRLMFELPLTNDWNTAVNISQRVYPGTAGRLDQIADHEGGRGAWVWYSGMCSSPPCYWTGHHLGNDPYGDDAVGGNLQFRYSTFIIYYPQMLRDLRRRGYLLPDLGWARPYVVAGASTGYGPWLSPLGQALTAAYMHYYGKQGSHWNF